MSRLLPLIAFLLASCGSSHEADRSSVTVTLPPPKAAPLRGFSEPVAQRD